MDQSRKANDVISEPDVARLSELENARAVDLIESAERSDPYCVCGRHMLAVAHDGSVWLECASRQNSPTGISALLVRLEAFLGHSSHRIMDLPATN